MMFIQRELRQHLIPSIQPEYFSNEQTVNDGEIELAIDRTRTTALYDEAVYGNVGFTTKKCICMLYPSKVRSGPILPEFIITDSQNPS